MRNEGNKQFYIKRIAKDLIAHIQKKVVTKEELINFFIDNYKDMYSLTVKDIVKAATLAGKTVSKNRGILEVNVSLKEQLEFYNTDLRLYSGKTRRYNVGKTLENNKELVISSYLSDISIREIAKRFDCSDTTVKRFLKKLGIIKSKRGKGKNG